MITITWAFEPWKGIVALLALGLLAIFWLVYELQPLLVKPKRPIDFDQTVNEYPASELIEINGQIGYPLASIAVKTFGHNLSGSEELPIIVLLNPRQCISCQHCGRKWVNWPDGTKQFPQICERDDCDNHDNSVVLPTVTEVLKI